MSKTFLSANPLPNHEAGAANMAGAGSVEHGCSVDHGTGVAHRAQILNIRQAFKQTSNELRRPEAPMFLEKAQTVLPIEFQGREIELVAHAYEDDSVSFQAMALVHRTDKDKSVTPVVRVHSGCVTGDIFHSLRCDCYQQLQKALEIVTASDFGIIIYLPHHEGRGIGLVNKIKAYAAQDRGLDTVDANLSIGAPVDARDYELAAKILMDLDSTAIRLLTNNPLKVEALQSLGIDVVEQVAHKVKPSRYNERYLETKRSRMAHKL